MPNYRSKASYHVTIFERFILIAVLIFSGAYIALVNLGWGRFLSSNSLAISGPDTHGGGRESLCAFVRKKRG